MKNNLTFIKNNTKVVFRFEVGIKVKALDMRY